MVSRAQAIMALVLMATVCCGAQQKFATLAKGELVAPFPKVGAYRLTNNINPKSSLQALINTNHTLFARVANFSGLTPALNATVTRATIFAPSNEAILKLSKDMGYDNIEEFLKNQMLVDRIAGYHIVNNATVTSSALKDGQKVGMAWDGNLTVGVSKKGAEPATVQLTGAQRTAKVTKADIKASNAVIHSIDNVLLPSDVFPNLKAALSYKVVTKSMHDLVSKDAEIVKIINDPKSSVTVFVPSEKAVKAFQDSAANKKLLADAAVKDKVLKYHFVEGAHILPNGVKAGQKLPTLLKGQTITVEKVVNDKKIGHIKLIPSGKGAKPAEVGKFNIIAGKSYMNVIDGLLVPAI